MTRAQFAKHLDLRWSHAQQSYFRAVEARRECDRIDTWHRNAPSARSAMELEKAKNAAFATETVAIAARDEFFDGLYDAFMMIVMDKRGDQ